MKKVPVKLSPRVPGKKSETKAMRAKGLIPAEIYGKGVENIHAWIDIKDVMSFPHGETFLVEAEVEGDKRVCILKKIDFGWLGDDPIHVDLYDLSHVKELEIEVPIQFIGKPAGVDLGGTFEAVMHTLTIKTSPQNIPERITVDVSGLGLGEVLHVRDIEVPEGCVVMDSPEETVALVLEPEVEEVTEEAAEEEEEAAATSE